MINLALKDVVKRFGAIEVINGVNLEINKGEFVVFVGPSGCGKSTLLRMIAGLEPISGGELVIDDAVVNNVPPSERGIAMVFQSYALYPHMSVYKNMAFGLETAGLPRKDIKVRVEKAADILQIGHLLDRKPKALSGGQRQRVAIGRAIVREPNIFLFDEPLSNLDAELRVQTRVEIAKLHKEIGATMIYVTHDQVEAMTLADRIVVLRSGNIEQCGRPLDLYNKPANRFIAGFIGSPKMNFLDVTFLERRPQGAAFELAAAEIVLKTLEGIRAGTKAVLGVRPEHITTGREADVNLGTLTVSHVEQLGGQTLAYGRLGDDQSLTIVLEGQRAIAANDTLDVGIAHEYCHLFGEDGNRLND
ncbi:sn-glycerol-3-phosphate ABC transporter ATP-binding protein UgpC [Phyllobacterium sp. P30BS-XVII]|uniref:ABC transporter ATP-binding protein n=1 Tax=Phyllobacterium sp. P30BS-XVII TaxID=2587046 RepID=UPI0015F8CCAE|nr:sn-glycerol-3-phosphate ABC transporter ATP-binding protein UgpC [Phyllobacterium sp. P30BS-XVII]MBA8902951.1 multiple sugar transport system ATP-binding protein [Phyllobacterium sp. P30BS-XVII]